MAVSVAAWPRVATAASPTGTVTFLFADIEGLAVDGDASDALGAVLIGLAEADGFVEGAVGLGGVGRGLDKQTLLDGLGNWSHHAGFRFGLGGGWSEQGAVQANGAERLLLAGRGPAKDYAGFDHGCGEVIDGQRGFAGEDYRGVGDAGGTAVAIEQFNTVGERTGRACGQIGRQRLSEGTRGVGGEKQIAGNGNAGAAGLFAADSDRNVAFEQKLVSVLAGHLPGEGHAVTSASGSQIVDRVRQVERGRKRRSRCAATGEDKREGEPGGEP